MAKQKAICTLDLSMIYISLSLLATPYRICFVSLSKIVNLYIWIEPEIKKQAEIVFDRMGILMSGAVGLFLNQVVINQGIPFALKAVPTGLMSVTEMSEEKMDTEHEKGYVLYLSGTGRSAREVIKEMRQELNV